MRHYKPITTTMEVPYVPENFMSILAEIAEEGFLFPERAPMPTEVERQRADYLRIRVPEPRDTLILRFDTLEVWRVNDHTLRYRVSYRDSSHALSGCWALLAATRHVLIFLLTLSAGRIHKSGAFSNFMRFTHEPINGESGAGVGPLMRPIGKRLKEIAVSLPA